MSALCAGFPGEYWRGLEPDRYPEEFVAALTRDGWLAALVPEEYGGAGLSITAASVILEEINASGGNAGACHAQMYTMGTILRHGSDEQKQRYLPRIASGELRLQAFGVTEPTVGSDTTSIQTFAERVDGGYVVRGQKIWTSRALHSDLMRYKAAWLFEQGLPCGAEANMAKLLGSEASWAAANACLDAHGGFGFAEEYDVERKFRETRLYSIAPVSNNLVLAYVGQHVLGMPRSY